MIRERDITITRMEVMKKILHKISIQKKRERDRQTSEAC